MKYGCQSMFDKLESILIKHPKDAFISQNHLNENWKAFNYEGVPHFESAIQEFSKFEELIREWVSDVHYLPVDKNVGIDSIYTHDSVKVTRHGAIYFPMGKKLRTPETRAMQSYLESIEIKTLGHIKGKGKMEGGDIVWLDDQTVAIGLGYRTNKEGIDQFKEFESVVIPVIRKAEVKYSKQGNGNVFSKADFVDTNPDEVIKELRTKKRAIVKVKVDVHNENSDKLMTSVLDWFFTLKEK